MFNQLVDWLSKLVSSWKFWIVIPPWDIGVRVRMGKTATPLGPGPHWRIPFLDDIVLVNTRLRISTAPAVTVSNGAPGRARCITAVVGFRIEDPVEALKRFDAPEPAVASLVAASVARLRTSDEAQEDLKVSLKDTGIVVEFVRYTEDVDSVRTIRLLQGIGSVYSGSGSLNASSTTRY